jgi:hypothetical protein
LNLPVDHQGGEIQVTGFGNIKLDRLH